MIFRRCRRMRNAEYLSRAAAFYRVMLRVTCACRVITISQHHCPIASNITTISINEYELPRHGDFNMSVAIGGAD